MSWNVTCLACFCDIEFCVTDILDHFFAQPQRSEQRQRRSESWRQSVWGIVEIADLHHDYMFVSQRFIVRVHQKHPDKTLQQDIQSKAKHHNKHHRQLLWKCITRIIITKLYLMVSKKWELTKIADNCVTHKSSSSPMNLKICEWQLALIIAQAESMWMTEPLLNSLNGFVNEQSEERLIV